MKQASKQIGGFARAAKLTPERRREIAINAIQTRWANKKAGTNPAESATETVIIESTCVPDVRPAN